MNVDFFFFTFFFFLFFSFLFHFSFCSYYLFKAISFILFLPSPYFYFNSCFTHLFLLFLFAFIFYFDYYDFQTLPRLLRQHVFSPHLSPVIVSIISSISPLPNHVSRSGLPCLVDAFQVPEHVL